MAASKITYTDKVQGQTNPAPTEQKYEFGDANEVKTAINTNADILDAETFTNRVIVKQSSDFGVIDSTKEYFLDGVIDMGTTSIEVPTGGISIRGYNLELAGLTSSENNYTMFTSPVGGSGNFFALDLFFTASGTSSKVYDLVADTGFEAHEVVRINYTDCSSLGEISGYRQGLESGTGRFGGTPNLILSGTWIGGYFIDTSIVRSLTDGNYALYEEGTAFTMASRFRSNQNIDLPASASFFDFAPANFVNASTVQIDGVIITRAGAFDATDSNITPNMSQGDLVANWMGNNGMPNTFVGGAIGVTTETSTTISSSGVFVDLEAALWTAADLQHFDNPSVGRLRHLGNTPREYTVIANFALDSTNGDDITLRVVMWDDSISSNVTVLDQTREVNNFVGGRNVAFFNININTELDENDYIFLQVANVSATNDVTAEVDSYFIVEAR